jgi:hypothetical protein
LLERGYQGFVSGYLGKLVFRPFRGLVNSFHASIAQFDRRK